MEKRHDWKVADRPGIPGDRWLCHEEVLGTGILRRGNAPAIDVEGEVFRLAERERKLRETLDTAVQFLDAAIPLLMAAKVQEINLPGAMLAVESARAQLAGAPTVAASSGERSRFREQLLAEVENLTDAIDVGSTGVLGFVEIDQLRAAIDRVFPPDARALLKEEWTMKLTDEDRRWIEWARTLPPDLQKPHDQNQGVSISAFKAGERAASARIRRELLDHFGPHALVTDKLGERMEYLSNALDRIIPENG